MPKKIAGQKGKAPLSAFECEGLFEAARAVVRAHHLRDRDEADDGDVGDAIAYLAGCLPRRQKRRPGKP